MFRTRARTNSGEDFAAVRGLLSDLESRLRRLNESVRHEGAGAAGEIRSFLSEASERLAAHLRDGAADVSRTVTAEASRMGEETMHRLEHEMAHRPLLLLGAAVAIGFLLGLASRRS
jgi:ElaB/YqjD/DUF883 family membrane-anchored ribosome-binding protein